ncbi:hypothetical protein EON82_10220 [bacterium]|nr:MAG: hypothetical protein EON82_10220 [bacterium]
MRWKNFEVWQGRLPHWRADDVTYYVMFRHRRPLDEFERRNLLRALLKPDGRQWELQILVVLPERTELLFKVHEAPAGRPYELSDIVEKAKTKVGRSIIKKTEERYPPFYEESYDRIVRDEAEFEERWQAIFDAPVNEELAESAEEYDCLWVADAPEEA